MKKAFAILSQLRHLAFSLIISVLLIAAAGFAKTNMSIFLSKLVDSALVGNITPTFWINMGISLALVLFFHLLSQNQFNKILWRGERDFFHKTIQRTLNAKYEELRTFENGDLLTRFNSDCSEFVDAMSTLLKGSISTLLQMVIMLVMLSFISWPMAVFCFAVPILYNLWFMHYSEKIQPVNALERDQMGKMGSHFIDCIDGWTEARIYHIGSQLEKIHNKKLQERDTTEKKKAVFWSKISLCDSLMSNLYPLGIIALGCILARLEQISWGQILVFLNLSPYFLNFIWDLDPQSFRRALAAAERIAWLWELPQESQSKNASSWNDSSSLIFDKVSYKYPQTDTYVLKEISFRLNSGDDIVILGESGSGKSTLLYLASGLIQTHDGTIIRGNSKTSAEALLDNICLVRQKTILHDDTLLFNVTLGACYEDTADQQLLRVSQILTQVELDYLLEREDGLMQKITTLSDGERQRIGLARCLYKKATLWFLDEPTSALDAETEAQILKLLSNCKNAGITMVVVTHRETVAKTFQKLLILHKGTLAHYGNRAELPAYFSAELPSQLQSETEVSMV